MNNILSYCGLVDARISASEKDLSVRTYAVECGVVDFVGEVECPSDVVVVSVGFAEVVGLGFSVVVLKVLKHT